MLKIFKKKDVNTKNEDKRKEFHKLTPITNLSEDKKYKNIIKFINDSVEDEELKNVGLIGNYATGKSSLIRSALKDSEKNVCYISMLHYENDFVSESKVEKKIIESICYSLFKDKNIYIKEVNRLSKKFFSGVYFLSLIVILFSVYINYGFETYIGDLLLIILFSSAYLSAGILLYVIFNYCKLNIKRLKVDSKILSFEAEKNDMDKNAFLIEKYTDEIIRMFIKNKNKNILVFEDIDRIVGVDTFLKLRGLNRVLNNIRNITFIYAIKDNLFKTGEDRTKFFDIIIPVMPIATGSNSYELFKRSLNIVSIENKNMITNKLLAGVGPYFRDPRLINNIINEYKLYILELKKEMVNQSELFMYICYKNLCPQDNYNFINGKGMLQQCMDIKKEKIEIEEGFEDMDKNQKDFIKFYSLGNVISHNLFRIVSRINETKYTLEDSKFIKILNNEKMDNVEHVYCNKENIKEYLDDKHLKSMAIYNFKLIGEDIDIINNKRMLIDNFIDNDKSTEFLIKLIEKKKYKENFVSFFAKCDDEQLNNKKIGIFKSLLNINYAIIFSFIVKEKKLWNYFESHDRTITINSKYRLNNIICESLEEEYLEFIKEYGIIFDSIEGIDKISDKIRKLIINETYYSYNLKNFKIVAPEINDNCILTMKNDNLKADLLNDKDKFLKLLKENKSEIKIDASNFKEYMDKNNLYSNNDFCSFAVEIEGFNFENIGEIIQKKELLEKISKNNKYSLTLKNVLRFIETGITWDISNLNKFKVKDIESFLEEISSNVNNKYKSIYMKFLNVTDEEYKNFVPRVLAIFNEIAINCHFLDFTNVSKFALDERKKRGNT